MNWKKLKDESPSFFKSNESGWRKSERLLCVTANDEYFVATAYQEGQRHSKRVHWFLGVDGYEITEEVVAWCELTAYAESSVAREEAKRYWIIFFKAGLSHGNVGYNKKGDHFFTQKEINDVINTRLEGAILHGFQEVSKKDYFDYFELAP